MYTDPAQSAFGGASSATSPSQNSYVDEYTPPAVSPVTPSATSGFGVGAGTDAGLASTPSAPTSTSTTTSAANAALDELERLLAEIKAKNESLKTSQPADPMPTFNPVSSGSGSTVPTFGSKSDFPPMSSPAPFPVSSATPTPASTPAPAASSVWEPKDDTLPDVALTQPPMDTVTAPMSDSTQTESLEDQNIFYLLGVTDGTDEQKESFLDELQQTIWEDFVDHDVKLLLTNDEYAEFEKERVASGGSSPSAQEKLMTWLEAKIPDLEDILLEKAIELKADMVRERIAGLREYYAGKTDSLSKLDEASRLTDQAKWYSAATLLNGLPK